MLAAAAIWDPSTLEWSATGDLGRVRAYHTAVGLQDGRVLVVGGEEMPKDPWNATVEIWYPRTGHWEAGTELPNKRYGHTATLLDDGRVLVAGGRYANEIDNNDFDRTSLWDPSTGLWSDGGDLRSARAYPTATRLQDGRVLIAGGSGRGRTSESGEVRVEHHPGGWVELARRRRSAGL